jgi:hypothetical protein
MKKNKTIGKYVIYTLMGFLLLATGAVLAKTTRDMKGVLETLPYIFIGIGSGIFGQNLGTIISTLTLRKSPDAARQLEIEESDERNIMIRNKAKAKSYDLMLLVYGALMLAFGLMKADLSIVLSMVAAYLFITFSSVFYSEKYRKEM